MKTDIPLQHILLKTTGCLALLLLAGCGSQATAPAPARDLSEYKTAYVGDAPNVVNIVSGQTWPVGLSYDHVKIQSVKQPFGLTVYLQKEPDAAVTEADLKQNADSIFSLVDNLEEIEFVTADSGRTLGFFSRGS